MESLKGFIFDRRICQSVRSSGLMAYKFIGKKDIFELFKVWDVQSLAAFWLDNKPFSCCWDTAMRSSINTWISANSNQTRLLRDEGFMSKVIDRELVDSADYAAYS